MAWQVLVTEHFLSCPLCCVLCLLSTAYCHSGDSEQHARGAAFGFNYAQLQPAPPSPGHDDTDPLGLRVSEPQAPVLPEYRPPFETIPWQLATNLPYDHITHQVGTCTSCSWLYAMVTATAIGTSAHLHQKRLQQYAVVADVL